MGKLLMMVTGVLCLAISMAAQASELKLLDSGICISVENHSAVGLAEVFDRGVDRLYCFTRVVGPYHEEKEQHVVHVWYYGEVERARVTLPVKSSSWGTYSSKKIQSHETGSWHVDVLDTEGNSIGVFQFYIKAQADVNQDRVPDNG